MRIGTNTNNAPPADLEASKIKKAAEDFEGLLIAQMLQSIRESALGGWQEKQDSSGAVALEMAESQLARSMASGHGARSRSGHLVPRAWAPARRPVAARVRRRLRVGHDVARHVDAPAPPRRRRDPHDGEPRSRHVVPPFLSRRRVVAVPRAQSVGRRGAWLRAGPVVLCRRHARGERRAGGSRPGDPLT